jgi:hypothetical protein
MRYTAKRFKRFGSRLNYIGAIKYKEGDDTVAGGAAPENEDAAAQPKNAQKKEEEPLGEGGKKALEIERAARRDLEKQIAELTKKYSGIDPEEVARIRTEAEERERRELEERGRYDELINRTRTKHEQEIAAERALTIKLRNDLSETRIEQAITEAFFGADGKIGGTDGVGSKDYAGMLLGQIRSRIAIDDSGDVIVVDRNGDQEFNPETAKPMTLDELMAECRSKGATKILFNPMDKAQGGGAYSNASRKARDQISEELAKLPPSSRIAKARELGLT